MNFNEKIAGTTKVQAQYAGSARQMHQEKLKTFIYTTMGQQLEKSCRLVVIVVILYSIFHNKILCVDFRIFPTRILSFFDPVKYILYKACISLCLTLYHL